MWLMATYVSLLQLVMMKWNCVWSSGTGRSRSKHAPAVERGASGGDPMTDLKRAALGATLTLVLLCLGAGLVMAQTPAETQEAKEAEKQRAKEARIEEYLRKKEERRARRELERKQNESDSTGTQLDKRLADDAMKRRDLELAIAEAEGSVRKARLMVDSPSDLVSALDLREAELDLELAEKTLSYQRTRAAASRRKSKYDTAYLRDKYQRTEVRVIIRHLSHRHRRRFFGDDLPTQYTSQSPVEIFLHNETVA